MLPEFSIVIPCYNCAGTIRQTVASVTQQGFSDYELVLVDDGSTDDTPAVLRELTARQEGKLRLITQPNAGVSAARNQGIRQCRGKYLLFLDADDLLAPGLLQAISYAMAAHPADTLCFLYTRREEVLTALDADRPVLEMPVQPLLERLTYSKREVLFLCFVYSPERIRQYGLSFTPGTKYGEDWEFATKYLAHCHTALLMEAFGYFYRFVPTSAMATVRYSRTDAIGAAVRAAEYLKERNHPFAQEFDEYMYPRAVFSVAHQFGHARNRELFEKLGREYDLRDVMKRMVRNPHVDGKSKLAAAAYLISPRLFYRICVF